MSHVTIHTFSDPTCPFEYSLEPVRYRLNWLFGNQITWKRTMIVLARDQSEVKFTPEQMINNYKYMSNRFGMPINDSLRDHIAPSIDLCRAFIAIDLNVPEKSEAFLRQLRLLVMTGGLNDDQIAINAAAEKVAISADELLKWVSNPATETKLQEDIETSRTPSIVAKALNHKLSDTPDGRRRYSAGSFQFIVDNEVKFELPGFWPTVTYEAAVANIAPELVRKQDPSSIEAVLEWTNEPLATQEILTILNQDDKEKVSKELQKSSATLQPVGTDGLWAL